jgi:hypothetical protein
MAMRLSSNNKTKALTRTRGPDNKRAVTPDDVIAVLLQLFAQLQIDPTQFSSRVMSARKSSLSGRLYSHTATVGEVLTAWHENPEYLDSAGNPSPIRIRGHTPSFFGLASQAAPGIDPAALLIELKRLGAITLEGSKRVRVNMRSLPVYMDRDVAIHYTLTSLHNYISTLRHNLESDPTNSDQLFHRIAWNDSFDRSLIPALKIKLRRQGQSFLESFDNWMARKTKSTGKRKKTKRAQISVGIYLAVDGARAKIIDPNKANNNHQPLPKGRRRKLVRLPRDSLGKLARLVS